LVLLFVHGGPVTENPLIIKYLDPVESWMSTILHDFVLKDLSYPTKYYRPGRFHKIKKEYEGHSTFVGQAKGGGYIFYTGLIPRVINYCKVQGEEVILLDMPENHIKLSTIPIPPSLNFRPFQEQFVKTSLVEGRGIFIAPTGTGKTVLGLGIIAYLWEHYKILWLCHTKSLMMQTAHEAKLLFGADSVGLVGDDNYDVGKYVTIATRQTFIKHTAELAHVFDMVLVDEAHHVSDLTYKREGGQIKLGQYFDVLKQLYCHLRFGLTATRPDSQLSKLAMESLLGPVIGEFTINEARELGYMADPKIKFKKLAFNSTVHDLRKYADVYEQGVVRNLEMNRDIAENVKLYAEQGGSSLIIVKQVIHGELILNMCRRLGITTEFVNGSTETQTREIIKDALNNKRIQAGICTSVWKEGINIPELDALFNAAQGKSELGTLQAIGRGLRRTATKTELLFHDYFNPSHRFLIEHFGQRLCLYMDNKWL
jgi:superfamily II DNA or RNA helicase